MLAIKFTLAVALFMVGFQEIRGQGKLIDPDVNRSSAIGERYSEHHRTTPITRTFAADLP